MSERIAWVTDSTGCLDEQLKKRNDLFIVPMVVIIDGQEYEDGINILPNDLAQIMKNTSSIPTTSQPSIGTFTELYKKLEQNFDRIVSVHVSGRLSGTVNSSLQAAKLVSIPVHVFDSELISYPMTLILKKLINEIENGSSIEEAFHLARTYRSNHETYVLIGSLEQLHRSGRLSSAKYILGSLLKLKPIISIQKGSLETKEKARSELKAENLIFEWYRAASESIRECCILYGSTPEQAGRWREKILSITPNMKVHIYPLGSAISVHTGAETLGISWFNEK